MSTIVDWNKSAAASRDIVDFLVDSYKDTNGVHAETVIGAAAALTGAYALLSIGPVAPGTQYVISDEVADLLLKGTGVGNSLSGVILQFAQAAGLRQNQLPNPLAINQRVIDAFGSKSYPPLSIPESNYPREWSPNAAVRLGRLIDKLLSRHQLNATEAAVALAIATGGIVKMTAGTVDPRITTTLALEIMIGVSKMRPIKREIGTT